jgi:creatinine amidohydrolase/Fe(II)-dependent formamide hydrolase-like protein
MLYLNPNMVRMELAVADGLEPHPPVYGLVTNVAERSAHGGEGRPQLATAELGERLYAAIVETLLQEISCFAGTITMIGSTMPDESAEWIQK